MKHIRTSGIILHPTSFPGPDGIGDLGPQAYAWIDFLESSGCTIWQTLPLGPTGYGDSPYQCFSASAGNPYLVSPTLLLDEGYLSPEDFVDRPEFPLHQVDFGAAIPWKLKILRRAYNNFAAKNGTESPEFLGFCEENKKWLDDYALFMSLKNSNSGAAWQSWSTEFKKRQPEALADFTAQNAEEINFHKFMQFCFFKQWNNLMNYAHEKGIKIIGDIPIFVSMDSADVWSNPDLFYLDEEGNPTVVAGVPPDYFSPTGQLWGNPLYRWPKHQETNFAWWMDRIRATLKVCDLIRLDHFRGFGGYWEIPAGNPTAEFGRWVECPGDAFLQKVQETFGDLPIIAEDLGEISEDVSALRLKYGLPGMKILQFGFDGDANDHFLPSNYVPNFVAYTGTHDNETITGWFANASQKSRTFAMKYLCSNGEHFAWDAIRAVWQSVAVYSIAPLQDFLELGNEARMNFPGRMFGNWSFRYINSDLTPDLAFRILDLNRIYNRIPEISGKEHAPVEIYYEKP